MAMDVRIRCINKSDRQNPHERISRVGGTNADGTAWALPEADAIAGIESGKWTFHVHVGQNTVKVIIAKSAAGHKYLKTEADGIVPDNLLALPECP